MTDNDIMFSVYNNIMAIGGLIGPSLYIAFREPYGRIQNLKFGCRSMCSCANCRGGEYHQFGSMTVFADRVELDLYTVYSIMFRRYCVEKYVFESNDPKYPDNVVEFLKAAAANALRVFKLARKRDWHKWRLHHQNNTRVPKSLMDISRPTNTMPQEGTGAG